MLSYFCFCFHFLLTSYLFLCTNSSLLFYSLVCFLLFILLLCISSYHFTQTFPFFCFVVICFSICSLLYHICCNIWRVLLFVFILIIHFDCALLICVSQLKSYLFASTSVSTLPFHSIYHLRY